MRKFKISRKLDYKNMLVRNMSTSLIIYEKIKTTKAKAKIIKSVVDHQLAYAKKETLASRRELKAFFTDANAVKKIYDVLIKRYAKRNSGFVKSYHLKPRLGDGSQMMMLVLVPEPEDITKNTKELNVAKPEIKNSKKIKEKVKK